MFFKLFAIWLIENYDSDTDLVQFQMIFDILLKIQIYEIFDQSDDKFTNLSTHLLTNLI